MRSHIPLKTYCYRSIINRLEAHLKRTGFEDLCEAWHERNVQQRALYDVYDGKVWKEFHESMSHPHFYGFSLNVDWYQPYKRSTDISIEAIYASMLNLPRELCFRRENMILV